MIDNTNFIVEIMINLKKIRMFHHMKMGHKTNYNHGNIDTNLKKILSFIYTDYAQNFDMALGKSDLGLDKLKKNNLTGEECDFNMNFYRNANIIMILKIVPNNDNEIKILKKFIERVFELQKYMFLPEIAV